jgi:hypothetical protein
MCSNLQIKTSDLLYVLRVLTATCLQLVRTIFRAAMAETIDRLGLKSTKSRTALLPAPSSGSQNLFGPSLERIIVGTISP